MENVGYVGLSAQIAQQRLMEVTANNLANMSTPGYKSQDVLFMSHLTAADKSNGGPVAQVLDYGSYRDMSPGTMSQTFNKFDFALNGDGFFVVETPDGPRYTRDGSFMLNDKRELVTKAGYKVMGQGGPIVLQPEALDITLTPSGEIVSNTGSVGRLQVVTFDNPQFLKPVGNNVFDGSAAQEKPATGVTFAQGMVEGSNVNPVVEMNKMIQVLRLYQGTQRILMADHERIRTMIDKLTQA